MSNKVTHTTNWDYNLHIMFQLFSIQSDLSLNFFKSKFVGHIPGHASTRNLLWYYINVT